eukprot:gene14916-biopygen8761
MPHQMAPESDRFRTVDPLMPAVQCCSWTLRRSHSRAEHLGNGGGARCQDRVGGRQPPARGRTRAQGRQPPVPRGPRHERGGAERRVNSRSSARCATRSTRTGTPPAPRACAGHPLGNALWRSSYCLFTDCGRVGGAPRRGWAPCGGGERRFRQRQRCGEEVGSSLLCCVGRSDWHDGDIMKHWFLRRHWRRGDSGRCRRGIPSFRTFGCPAL